MPENFAVHDNDGKRYVAELAVAWAGDDAFWTDYVESGGRGG